MKIASQSTLLLSLAFYFFLLHNSSLVASDAKITSSVDSGYKIGIDCGSTEEEYLDSENNMWYKPDSGFVETGPRITNYHQITASLIINPKCGSNSTLRSFPDGKRNCYTLTATQGRNNKYIVRAFFAYGNYDLKNKKPVFDLYLGVNRWQTIKFDNDTKHYYSVEVILVALTDTISVCLVNTGNGDPIISSLELWPLGASTYPVSPSLPWDLLTRSTPGRKEDVRFIRFKDDIYGRVWFTRTFKDSRLTNTSVTVDLNGKPNPLDMPPQVLKTAIESTLSPNNSSFAIYEQLTDSSDKYFFYFYFFEFDQNATTQKRICNDHIFQNSKMKTIMKRKYYSLNINEL